MTSIVRYYDYLMTDIADPRTNDWLFIRTPWSILGILALYLLSIYKILPAYMERRTPFDLKTVIAAYNLFQVFICTVLIYGVATSGWTTDYTLGCQPADFSESETAMRMASFLWLGMMVKLVELVETVFFVLRKKYNQVSFLHVYHHSSSFIVGWLGVKYYAGGMMTFCVLLNSFVHVVMYSYYLLASLGPEMQKKLEPVKSKVTILQIAQLVAILVHTLQVLSPSCPIPSLVGYIYAPILLINIVFFVNFYRRAYMQKKKTH